VASSVATYTLTTLSTDALGSGWTVVWVLVYSAGVGAPDYTYRWPLVLCEYVPPCTIDETALYVRIPELRHRLPQAQRAVADGGDGSGWQPQIDAAYYELLQRLLDDGQTPWKIRGVVGYRELLLVRALRMCIGAISYGPDSSWAQLAKELAYEQTRVEARFRVERDEEGPEVRRPGSPMIRLAPVGRPPW